MFHRRRRHVRKSSKSSRPRKLVRKAVASARAKIFRKKVLSVVQRQAENKQAYQSTGNTPVYFNSGISGAGDCQQIVPYVSSGTADNQRIGDEIRAKSLLIRGAILMQLKNDTSLANRKIGVRVMIVQPRRYTAFQDITGGAGNWQLGILKKGGSVSAFTGTMPDLWAPLNKDELIIYYDKVHYMSIDAVTTSSAIGSYSQDVRQTTKFINIRVPCRNKLLRYDSSADAGTLPAGWNPVMLVGYSYLDFNGGGPDTVTTSVGVCYDSMLTFEDS